MTTTVHWFRRDLRLHDNPALADAGSGEVVPVFIVDPGDRSGGASNWWLDRSLRALRSDLESRGCALLLREGDPGEVLIDLASEFGASRVVWNRLYEPRTIQRDTAIKGLLENSGLATESFNGALLHEPWTVLNGTGGPYKVFTPFWKRARLEEPDAPIGDPGRLHGPAKVEPESAVDALGLKPRIEWAGGLEADWTPGESAARVVLERFLTEAASDYPVARDIPGRAGTSRLSPYLHFGEISPHRVWQESVEYGPEGNPQDVFLAELGWREFAHSVLFHFPHTVENPMDPRFEDFPWRESAEDEEAWKRGRTGYPIVDAGMRQLWETGWMHNRVRMIVASFLVKHLGLHWAVGAEWFADTLVDADLAANTMGWQWSAGCGADAAPYFRVFNPILQGKKFDPDGEYVKRWVPEIAALPRKFLHEPWKADPPPETYPSPIVGHTTGRVRALGLYERWKKSKSS